MQTAAGFQDDHSVFQKGVRLLQACDPFAQVGNVGPGRAASVVTNHNPLRRR
jgi:hypothetical protein